MAYLLQQLLADSAAREPERPAVAVGDQFLTYAELDRLSDQVAGALDGQGVAPGDRVGILVPQVGRRGRGPVRRAEGGGLLRAA